VFSGFKHKLFLAILLVSAAVLVWAYFKRDRVVLKIAILRGQPSRHLRERLEEVGRPSGFDLPARLEVQAFEFEYEDLYKIVSESRTESNFDVVMLDDPWLPELVYTKSLKVVPSGTIDKIKIQSFTPEFLRVCYYHNTKFPPRPTLEQVKKAVVLSTTANKADPVVDLRGDQKGDTAYEPYALPFVGNVQVLARHTPNGADSQLDKLLKTADRTWDNVENVLNLSKEPFFSRLGTNNSAVADFLPILWSNGGCLVRLVDGKEVSGLDLPLARRAFEQDLRLKELSPIQHARFKDQDVFDFLSPPRPVVGQNSVGISWLAYRAGTDNNNLKWYVMPPANVVNEPPHAEKCNDNQEPLSDSGLKRPGIGVLGAWLLAVPRGASNPDVAWNFIVWALAAKSGLPKDGDKPFCDTPLGDPKSEVGDPKSEYEGGQPVTFEKRLSCGVQTAIRASIPRPAHPRWHQIEEAVGFRIRQAHWGTVPEEEGKRPPISQLASRDLQEILNRWAKQKN
jgi:hypothetical protein